MTIQRKQSLWEIKSEYLKLVSSLYNPETGEVDEQVDKQLTELTGNAENKLIAIMSWVKHLESEKKQIEFMKQEVLEREQAYDNAIAKQLNHIESNMRDMGIKEISCPYFKLQMVTNAYSTDVYDESQIPDQYMRKREIVKTEIKPDKIAIKDDVLRTGVQVPGANVSQKTKLKIVMDKI